MVYQTIITDEKKIDWDRLTFYTEATLYTKSILLIQQILLFALNNNST